MATAFGTQGATPTNPFSYPSTIGLIGSTPQAKALSTAAAPTPPPIPKPSTPVASIKSADGTTTTFHKPATTGTSSGVVPQSGTSPTGHTTALPGGNEATPPAAAGSPDLSAIQAGLLSVKANLDKLQSANTAPTFPGLVKSTADVSQGNIPIGEKAAGIAADYGKQIADVGKQGAAYEAGQLTTGTTPVAEGNAAVTAQTTAQQQQALASGESAALQGTGQELTAQNQAQSGLSTAAGLVAPSANFPYVFDPGTGTYKNQSTGSIMSAGDAAKAVLAGTMSYDQAKSALGYLGGTSESQLQSAIQSAAPGTDINKLQAQAAGQASLAAQLPTLKAAVNKAGGIYQTVTNFLASNPDINSNPDSFRNAAQQWLSGTAVVDPKYSSLFNVYLPEYLNSITPILGAAGNQTNYKTEIAQGFINPQGNAQSIKSTIDNVNQAVNDAYANISSAAGGGGTVAGGTSPGTPPSSAPTTITTTASDGNSYGFHQDANGQWVTN